jgi:Tol biopolymer transport system component
MRHGLLGGILILVAACGRSEPALPGLEALSTEDARDFIPTPSPDGSQLAFWRPGAEGRVLWVADAGMTNARSLGVYSPFTDQPMVWSPDGERIAVAVGMRNPTDLVTVGVSDGAVTWLVESPQLKVPVQFHPDGDRLLFAALTAEGSLGGFTVSNATLAVQPLIANLGTPYFGVVSPDGTQILFSVFEQGSNTLWAANADGSNRRQLTTEGFEEMTRIGVSPFSPDGSQVLYTSRRTGRRDIWVASLADGTTRQLTAEIQDDYDPVWSPDDRSVAFLSNRGRQTDVWVMPAAGGEATRVTDSPEAEGWVAWTVSNTLSFSVGHSRGAFWVRALADGSETRLTPDSVDVGFFVPSSDHQRLAFLIDLPGEVNDLAVMPASGGTVETVARGARHNFLAWNGDATRLAYSSDQAGSVDAWVVEPGAGSGPRPLTDWQGSEQVMGWTADGSAIYIYAERESQLGDLWKVPLDGADPIRVTTDGTVWFAVVSEPRAGMETVLVVRLESGVQTAARVNADGTLTPLTTPADGNMLSMRLTPDGEVVAATFQSGGAFNLRLLRISDRTTIATVPGAIQPRFSANGTRLLYHLLAGEGNAVDIGILDIAAGTTTRVTTTPEDESHAAFTADGNSIILRRVKSISRVMRADVSGIVGSVAP